MRAAFLATCLLAANAAAQSASPSPNQPISTPESTTSPAASLSLDPQSKWDFHSVNIRWNNDGTFAKPLDDSDRHYTNGAKFDFAWTPTADAFFSEWWTPAGSDWSGARTAVGLTLQQLMYTGRDITDPNPPEDIDRPYAGIATVGLYLQRATERVHDHLSVEAGVVGEWSGAELAQRFVHQTFPEQNEPRGWGDQLANEPVINFNYTRTWKSEPAQIGSLTLEALPTLGLEAGTIRTRANLGMTVRLGQDLPNDFTPGALIGFRDATGTHTPSNWSWYLYTTVQTHVVARDITLNGNTWKASRRVDHNAFVADAALGAVVRYKNIQFSYSATYLTEEFRTQPGSDAYGEWSITIFF